MSRRNHSLLSEETKQYLARIQGAGDRAHPYDYGELTSREAGNFTKYAVAAAEELLAGKLQGTSECGTTGVCLPDAQRTSPPGLS